MRYNRNNGQVELSVRELCALALTGGSIDTRRPPRDLRSRTDEGREVHEHIRSLQLQRAAGASAAGAENPAGESYHADYPLHAVTACEGLSLSVSGRADGVWLDPAGGCVVEAAHTSPAAYALARSPRESDMAELTCLAHFLALERGLSAVTLRLMYARPGDEDEALYTDAVLSAAELAGAYLAMLRRVLPRVRDYVERETAVRDAARTAAFPYGHIREAQEEMILECWRDMRAGKTLFAEAPTGIGKTISTLYPAVRCLGEDRCDKIFYLTAKNATRREAVAAAERLVASGTPIRAAVITAREAVCLCEGARAAHAGGRRLSSYCNPHACPFAKGYYDRADGVIEALLQEASSPGGGAVITGARIREAARRGGVCPYELALDLSERCEVVICDYNYVFSPAVYLRRYFADGIPGTPGHRYIFLVDEAHNLPDRARDMYSATLSLSELCAVQDALAACEERAAAGVFPMEDNDFFAPEDDRTAPRLTAASLDDLIGTLGRMQEGCRETLCTDAAGVRRGVALEHREPVLLAEAVRQLTATADRWLRRHEDHELAPAVEGLTAALRAFRTAADYYDEAFVTYTEVEGEDVRVRLSCLDPAGILRPILARAVSSVLFSATLTPAEYFADILGGGRDSVLVRFDSPFPPEHLSVVACPAFSARFEDRERAAYARAVSYIAATISPRPGNYMVYLPSYEYLEEVARRFRSRYPQAKAVVQTPGMTQAEREAFIASFDPEESGWRVGFCVLGGSFSEGVDLPGKALIGVLIVGVGIPGLSSERNIMRDHYAKRFEAVGEGGGERTGYDYAYTYPGMNHVLQAAGRVIRRDEDRGVVVLLDDRYAEDPYLHLYPAHWEGILRADSPQELAHVLGAFWQEVDADIAAEAEAAKLKAEPKPKPKPAAPEGREG